MTLAAGEKKIPNGSKSKPIKSEQKENMCAEYLIRN